MPNRPLRVLSVGEFDPAGVSMSHRNALRASGAQIDYRVAVCASWRASDNNADFPIFGSQANTARREMVAFAREAHVVQVNPGIGAGDGWAISADHDAAESGKLLGPAELLALESSAPAARRVAFVHGSPNFAARKIAYAGHLRAEFLIAHFATSTLDYAVGLEAAYLPPCVETPRELLARMRMPGETLRVVHTPTNPAVCHTSEFFEASRSIHNLSVFSFSGYSHLTALWLKSQAHACFDHLRGSFSVNTLEACAMGLVPIVRVDESCFARLKREELADPPFINPADATQLRRVLQQLASEPASLTAQRQVDARGWLDANLGAAQVASRLTRFYERIAA